MDSEVWRRRLRDALTEGDGVASFEVVRGWVRGGIGLSAFVDDVLAPVMHELGERWFDRSLSVAVEHRATRLAEQALDQLAVELAPAGREPCGRRILVCALTGERHALAIRAVGHVARLAGWQVEDVGVDLPVHDLAGLAAELRPDAVALSSTMGREPHTLAQLRVALREIHPTMSLVVGGQGFAGAAGATAGFDVLLESCREFEAWLADLDNAQRGLERLEDYLERIGARIAGRRRELAWTQAELAARASIDRTYLSGVERGRQNVSLAVAFRLARAMGLRLGELLDESPRGL